MPKLKTIGAIPTPHLVIRFLITVRKIANWSHPILINVARLYIFKPKIPILVNFGVSCNVGKVYGHVVYFTVI
jgi:hypothetical protein